MKRKSYYRVISVACGMLLIGASLLKGYQYLTEGLGDESYKYPALIARLLILYFELFLGGWLVSLTYQPTARVTAALTFGLFSIISLWQVLTEKPSCGCFGFLTVKPIITLLVDVAAVLSFVWFGPTEIEPARQRRRVGLLLPLYLISISIGTILFVVGKSEASLRTIPRELDLGSIKQGGRSEAAAEVVNNSQYSIYIADVETTCHCLKTDTRTYVIGPHESKPIKVTLDLSLEPNFTGDLRMKVYGKDGQGRIVFEILESVHVVPR